MEKKINYDEIREKEIYRCKKCGEIFFYVDSIKESRGEWFGFPSYEEIAVSPCCNREFYDLEKEEKLELSEEEICKAIENEELYEEIREIRYLGEFYM